MEYPFTLLVESLRLSFIVSRNDGVNFVARYFAGLAGRCRTSGQT
jgi:hypothetical protein